MRWRSPWRSPEPMIRYQIGPTPRTTESSLRHSAGRGRRRSQSKPKQSPRNRYTNVRYETNRPACRPPFWPFWCVSFHLASKPRTGPLFVAAGLLPSFRGRPLCHGEYTGGAARSRYTAVFTPVGGLVAALSHSAPIGRVGAGAGLSLAMTFFAPHAGALGGAGEPVDHDLLLPAFVSVIYRTNASPRRRC